MQFIDKQKNGNDDPTSNLMKSYDTIGGGAVVVTLESHLQFIKKV